MAHQIEKAERRERARRKAQHGMRISNRSIFTIVGAEVKRAEKIKKKSEK